MFRIVLASFQINDKLDKAYFFQKTFLLPLISINVIQEILFLIFNNANILFVEKNLI